MEGSQEGSKDAVPPPFYTHSHPHHPNEQVNGVDQHAIEGVSMIYTFDNPDAESKRETQYFEMVRASLVCVRARGCVFESHAPSIDFTCPDAMTMHTRTLQLTQQLHLRAGFQEQGRYGEEKKGSFPSPPLHL